MAALAPNPGPDYAAALAAPPLANLRRIGDEMFAWQDTEPPLPRGAALRHLVREHAGPGREVLVAGPHHDELITALVDGGARVTWLLRSLLDAEAAAGRFPAVTVLAGAVRRLDPDVTYDLVVAADGVDRLNSAEGAQLTVPELVDRLAAAVRPAGVLLLVHENHFGVHSTVLLETPQAANAAWYRRDEHDPARPASREQLIERLTEAGLAAGAAYAAFPSPAAPTVLVGPGLLGDVASPLRPWLSVALSHAFRAAFRGRPVLTDPRRLVDRALHAGAESVVAPAWVVVARGKDAPELLPPESDLRTFVDEKAGSGFRRVAATSPASTPPAYLLGERLLHLAATADLRGLRAELARYDRWFRDDPNLADLTDIVMTADGPTLPIRWESAEPIPADTAEIRAVWRFAVELIAAGHPHPWPTTATALDLTAIMLGMVDRSVTEDTLRPAVELQLRLDTADFDLTGSEQQERRRQLLSVSPGAAPVDIVGYRELTEALWRQRYEASHLLAMMEWTERIIESRDSALSKMDLEIQFYRRTWPGRILMGVKAVRRALRRTAGKAK